MPVGSIVQTARVTATGADPAASEKAATSARVFSVQDVAIKRLATITRGSWRPAWAAWSRRRSVADQIAQKNKLLGAVAWVALNATDRADVRQWSLLPESFQIARLPVKAGKYKVTVDGLDGSGNPTADRIARA